MFSDAAQAKNFVSSECVKLSKISDARTLLEHVDKDSDMFAKILGLSFGEGWSEKNIDVKSVKSLILDKQAMTNVEGIERVLDKALGDVSNEGNKKDVKLLTNTFHVKQALKQLKEMAQEASQEGAKLLYELSGIKGLQLFGKIATLNDFEMEKLMALDLDKKQIVELGDLKRELIKLPMDLRNKGVIFAHDGVLALQNVEKILGKLQARAPSPEVHRNKEEEIKMREDISSVGKAAPKTKAELKEKALEDIATVGGYHSKASKKAEQRLATKEQLINFNNTYSDRIQENHFIITDHIRSHPKFGTSNKDPHVYFEIIKHREGEEWRTVHIRYGQEGWSVLPDKVEDKEGNWKVKNFESLCQEEGLKKERKGKITYQPEPEPDQEEVDNFVSLYFITKDWIKTAPPLNFDREL